MRDVMMFIGIKLAHVVPGIVPSSFMSLKPGFYCDCFAYCTIDRPGKAATDTYIYQTNDESWW